VRDYRMRQVELARAGTFLSPLSDELACRRKLHHATVAVSITHIEATIVGKGDISRLVEMMSVVALHARFTNRHQQLAIVSKLHYLLQEHVCDPDIVGGIDAQSVWAIEHV